MPETTQVRLTPRPLVLALLLGIAVLCYADRYLLAGLAQPIKREFGLSDTVLGVLLGPAFALLYTILGVPAARLADRWSRIAVAAGGCLLWSLFTALTAVAQDAWLLGLARVGVGIGEAAYQAPVMALIAAYFPPQQRGRALALMACAIYIGQMTGMAGGPALAAASSWRTPFALLGGVGLAMALAAWLIIKEPPREPVPTAQREHEPLISLARRLVRARSWILPTMGLALGSFSGVSFGLWGPALFERAYGLTTQAAGAAFGLPFGISGLVGTLCYGFVSDRVGKRGTAAPLRLAAAALTVATVCIFAITWVPSLGMAQLLAIPSGLLGGGWSVGIFVGFQYILPERHRASGTAIALLAVGLIGNLAGPWFVGLLSDLFGGGLSGLRISLTLAIPLGLVGALAMWRASGLLDADRRRLAGEA